MNRTDINVLVCRGEQAETSPQFYEIYLSGYIQYANLNRIFPPLLYTIHKLNGTIVPKYIQKSPLLLIISAKMVISMVIFMIDADTF